MKTITNIADRLFRKVEPVDSAFGSEAAEAAVEGAAGETSRQTCTAFLAETRTPAFCAIDCPGRCPLELHLRDGELARVSANKAAPACHRGLSMRAWANSPDRLMWPLRRVGPRGSAQFERVTWDEALDEIADQVARIRREHGNESIYLAYTTGQSCTTADPFERLMNRFGGFLDHYNNYSNPQINAMVRSMYGPGALYPGGSELDAAGDARLVLAFGASPAETGTGRATWHGAWDRVVEQVGKRGGRIVMVDPRRNGSIPKRKGSSGETVSWLPINPGTDGALAAALLHELAFTHNALDWDFLRERCIGFTDETLPERWRGMGLSVMDYLHGTGYDHMAKTPAWAAAITGIPADDIRELASQLATARPAFIMQGWGPQRRSNGEMTSGMIMMLAAALGQVGLPGTNNGMNIAWGGGFLTRVSAGENHIPFRIPAYRFLDAIENGEALGAREGVRGLPEAGCSNAEDASSADKAQAGCANAEGPGSTQEAPTENDAARGFALAAKASLEQTSHSNRATDFVQHQDSAAHLPCSIKAIICHGGNCLTNQHGDVNRAHRVLGDPSKCEFILNIDVELTDSARYADIVLPDLFRMEQESAMNADAWGRRIAVSTGELGARFERRGAWEVCVELAKRWGIEDAFTEGRTEGEWIRRLYEGDRERSTGLPTFDRLLEEGLAWRADRTEPFVALADWRSDPDAHPLDTPSGKIELFSEQLAAAAEALRGTPDEGAITPIPTYVPEWGPAEFAVERPATDGAQEPDAELRADGHGCESVAFLPAGGREYESDAGLPISGRKSESNTEPACDLPLRVFGFHSVARIHSSWGNVPAVSRRVPQVISINPADADARGIATDDLVEASNRFGTLRLPAHVTEDVIAGTIVMPQGAWWQAEGRSMQNTPGAASARTADADAAEPIDVGGCINTLTTSRPSPLAFGNPQHTCWCHLRRHMGTEAYLSETAHPA
ncbi:molybdopterin-dependent oxidoreductase [Senegalimassilia anaerobia]|uniref:molybdopterin-dependent oxidoreductase n=1 Tax=Senegalimassilia anaerobia TaxID=1473216 RepID=UPI00248E6CD7|nr:molybdopterin-dependent oxidoreductase [Senegalimassilia anaerobia]